MRKLLLLAATAIAAFAFMAPSASATLSTGGVHIFHEGPSADRECPKTFGAANACLVHVVTSTNPHAELEDPFGGHVAECANEFQLEVLGNGSGRVTNFLFTPEPDLACANFVAKDTPWPFVSEEDTNGTLSGTITAELAGVPILGECHGTVELVANEDITVVRTGMNILSASEVGFGGCRVKGSWVIEAPQPPANTGNLHAIH